MMQRSGAHAAGAAALEGWADPGRAGNRAFLAGGGETGALMLAHDWSCSPLGPPESWPQSLRSVAGLLLSSKFPMFVAWGAQLGFLYNDAYAEILGAKHPRALGMRFQEIWAEIWPDILPMVDAALAGEATYRENLPLVVNRRGYDEDAWFSFSYSPVRDESGRVVGMFCTCMETTGRLLAERRLRIAGDTSAREAAEREAILGQLAEGVIVTDARGRITFVNEAAERLHGVKMIGVAPDAYTDTYSLLTEAGDPYPPQALPLARAVLAGEIVEDARWRVRHPDGSEVLAIGSARPVRDADGARIGAVLTVRDDTARRSAETALRASEARLAFLDRLGAQTAGLADADAVLATTTRLLGEHLSLSVCAYADMDEDENGFTIRDDWTAPGASTIVGRYSLAAFGERAVSELSAGRPLVVNDNARELPPKAAATFQSIGIAATICMPLVKQGRLTALMAIHDRVPRFWTEAELSLLRAVTSRSWAHVERVAATAQLRASEARFRLMADAVPQIVWITDAEGRVEFFNKQWFDYVGEPHMPSTASEVAQSRVHPEDRAATLAAFDEAQRTGGVFAVEHRIRSMTDEYRWFLVRAEPYRDPATGAIARWFGASTDIHDRKLAEERLRHLNDTLEAEVAVRTAERDRMWNTSPDLMLVIDFEGYFRRVNPAWTTLLGYRPSELLGRHVNEFVLPDDHEVTVDAYRLAAAGGRPAIVNRFCHKDGSTRWISWVAAPAGDMTYATGRDVTAEVERQAALEVAQEQLRQSQKMEAMGQLTGGVAHDFNNLLTPIIGPLDMLVRRGLGDERERRMLGGALQSAERAKVLVQRLLAFARRQPLQPAAIDLGRLVAGMADLIGSTLGASVGVQVTVEEDLPHARADANQIEMALLNLMVNARDAMPNGGRLTIAVARARVEAGNASGLAVGDYVRLSVTDTGVGMDEATRARAVEPFFSTKGVGRGTGLGLSTAHGLAAQLGGGLDIESALGRGTSVHLWLPVGAGALVEAPTAPLADDRPRTTHGVALVVDDEDLVRASLADMLVDLGFDVLEAASGEEALSRALHAASGRTFLS